MNSWNVIFATVVIFGTGVVTGGLLVNYVDHSHPRTSKGLRPVAVATNQASQTNGAAQSKPSRLPEVLNKQFLQRLDEELHLVPDQHEAVQKIIGEGQNQIHKLVQDARLEIREVLTPDQRKQFDELVKRPQHKPATATNAPAAGAP